MMRKRFVLPFDKAGGFSKGKVCLVCGIEDGVTPLARCFTHTRVVRHMSWLLKILNVFGAVLVLAGMGGLMAVSESYESRSVEIAIPLCHRCRESLEAEENRKQKLGDIAIRGAMVFLFFTIAFCCSLLLFMFVPKEVARILALYVAGPILAGWLLTMLFEIFLVCFTKKANSIKIYAIGKDFITFRLKPKVFAKLEENGSVKL